MFNPIQIILLILACHVIGTLGQNVQLVAKFGGQQVFRGLIAGFIMGDVKTGLLIGGTFQLMSMGLAAYGGASIPNFNTALWISVPFAIASGTDAPLELAMAVGVPVATLGIQLDVIAKTVNSYWYHRAEKHVEKREYKKLYRDILIGEYGFGRAALGQTLPVIIFLLFGEPIVQLIINYMPVWLTSAHGFRRASGAGHGFTDAVHAGEGKFPLSASRLCAVCLFRPVDPGDYSGRRSYCNRPV